MLPLGMLGVTITVLLLVSFTMHVTPKDFFLWVGAMVSLYASVVSFISVVFEYINKAFPDPLESYVDPYSSAMRMALATLVVAFPIFLALMHFIRKEIAEDQAKQDFWVRRWALTLTLFIAGVTVAIDIVTLINTYLGGDMSMRFGLKVLLVLLVALGGFLHFLADLRGHWNKNVQGARLIGYGSLVLIIFTIISGVLIMGSPAQVRLYRLDDQKVSDLQNIQWQIVDYWQTYEKLPKSLADLTNTISGYTAPEDPQSGASYGYEVIPGKQPAFKLCATFNAQDQNVTPAELARPATYYSDGGLMQDSWWHTEGDVCFTRTIDPERYPPYENPKTIR